MEINEKENGFGLLCILMCVEQVGEECDIVDEHSWREMEWVDLKILGD